MGVLLKVNKKTELYEEYVRYRPTELHDFLG